MTKEAKSLKLSCLCCLFAGVFVAAAAIYLIVTGGFGPGQGLAIGVGVASLVCGAQCARLANVPSNASKIRGLVLVLALLGAVVAGVGFGLHILATLEVALCAGVALVALVTAFLAQRLVKMLERV